MEIGGGVCFESDVYEYLLVGVDWVILGSLVVFNFLFVKKMLK